MHQICEAHLSIYQQQLHIWTRVPHWNHSLIMGKQALHIFFPFHPHCHSSRASP